MPRAKYTITAEDVNHATFYISGRIRDYEFEFHDDVSDAKAERDFREAAGTKGKVKRAIAVNLWCVKYLTAADWGKLKAAVRKRRERWQREGEQKTITVSANAHRLLSKVSERDNVTFSEALEHYLPKALKASRGRAGKRR